MRKKHTSKILVITALGLLLLSTLIIIFPLSSIDIRISEEVQATHSPLLDLLMVAISWFGHIWVSVIMVSISTGLLLLFKHKMEAIYCFLTLGIGLLTYVVKISVNRPRPGFKLVRIIEHAKFQGFPSGHVAFYIAFFGLMAFYFYRNKWLKKSFRITITTFCLGIIFLIPFSRVYLGAHWFTDVFGGFLEGCFYLTLLIYFYLDGKESAFRKL
ncbi:membrane-associated phospholipid phosphatase [Pedobacter sp. UYP30]|uniref:phosphatase PAP2 family protein n=1 Tax=Pedobacter sp. UYP30 TaxID=1756400 RepID=UPI003398FF94